MAPVPAGATTGNVVVTVVGSGEQRSAFTVLATPSITSLSPTSGGGRNFGNDHGNKFRSNAGNEHGSVQRDGGDTDELERDEHRGAGAGRSDDWKRGGDGGREWRATEWLHGDCATPSITTLSPTSGVVGASVTITGRIRGDAGNKHG